MYSVIRIFCIISSLTSLAADIEWDSPLCLTCNEEDTTILHPKASTTRPGASHNFRASSSSSSSSETGSSEDSESNEVIATSEQPTPSIIIETTESSTATSDVQQTSTKREEEREHHRKKKKHAVTADGKPKIKEAKTDFKIVKTALNDKNKFGSQENQKGEGIKGGHKIDEFKKQVDDWHEVVKNQINSGNFKEKNRLPTWHLNAQESGDDSHDSHKKKSKYKEREIVKFDKPNDRQKHKPNESKKESENNFDNMEKRSKHKYLKTKTIREHEDNNHSESKTHKHKHKKTKSEHRNSEHDEDKTNTVEKLEEKINEIVYNKPKHHDHNKAKNKKHPEKLPQSPSTIPTTSTVKYYDSPFLPHKIKDDAAINGFTKQILLRTLRLFDGIRKNSTEYPWKKKVKELAHTYEHKFKEFLRSSSHQNIKTKLGIQKVVFNAIDMSNQIVNRLLNIMVSDIDKKGLLRTSRTQNVFHKELDKEVESELNHACSKLGICRTRNGFIQILTDVLTAMTSLNDRRFKEAFDSLTEVAKYTDFSHTLGKEGNAHLKKRVAWIEDKDVSFQRSMVTIVKNILVNRNKPILLYPDTDPRNSNVNGTLAFLEVIDTLDKTVPINEANIEEWTLLRDNMIKWSDGVGIQATITRFVKYIKKTIESLDRNNHNTVMENAGKIFW